MADRGSGDAGADDQEVRRRVARHRLHSAACAAPRRSAQRAAHAACASDANAALASFSTVVRRCTARTVIASPFDRFLSTPEILAVFETRPFVQSMLDFEAAL